MGQPRTQMPAERIFGGRVNTFKILAAMFEYVPPEFCGCWELMLRMNRFIYQIIHPI